MAEFNRWQIFSLLSQERFNCFMRAVAHEFPRERIIVVGLSLGNVLIDNFFLQHRPNEIGRTFDPVIFARADMDLMAFKSHLPRIAAHARKVFVCVDDHDFVINLSQLLRMVACPVVHGERVGRMTSGLQTFLERGSDTVHAAESSAHRAPRHMAAVISQAYLSYQTL